jgi:hypothetical protein
MFEGSVLVRLRRPLFEDAHVFSDKHPIFLNPDQESETKVGFVTSLEQMGT